MSLQTFVKDKLRNTYSSELTNIWETQTWEHILGNTYSSELTNIWKTQSEKHIQHPPTIPVRYSGLSKVLLEKAIPRTDKHVSLASFLPIESV